MSQQADPLRSYDNRKRVRTEIEKGQRQQKRNAPRPGEGETTVYSADGGLHRRLADGSLQPVVPDPAYVSARARADQLARATADAESAFRRAVLDDFASAAACYLAWTDARRRQGGYADVPRFGEIVDQILYSEAAQRNHDGR